MRHGRTLRFVFDYISPYAYLAWTQIHDLAERCEVDVEPVPVLFAAMLKRYGHLGPAEIPPKRAYVFKDVLRRAHRFGVPVEPPPGHPFNPLPALRATLASPPDRRRAVIDGLFASTWAGAEPRGVDTVDQVVTILAAAGVERTPEQLAAPEVKAALRANTDEAIEAGCFGVPSMLVEGELFWGSDSLDDLEAFLSGDDPVDAAMVVRWEELPASQRRPR